MFKCCAVLSVVLLYQCTIVYNFEFMDSDDPPIEYEQMESDQYLKKLNVTSANIAFVIEDSARNFKNGLNFFGTIFTDAQYENRDFWLFTFNSSGGSTFREKSIGDTNEFSKKLESLAPQSRYEPKGNISDMLVIFSLIATAKELPPHSSMILFSDTYFAVDTPVAKSKQILNKNVLIYSANINELQLQTVIRNVVNLPEDNIFNTTMDNYELFRQNPYNITEKNVSDNLTRQNLINVNKLSIPIDNDIINTTNEQKYELYRQDPYNITEKNVSDNLTIQNLINVNKLSIPIENDVTNTTNEQKYELYRQDPYNITEKNVSDNLTRQNLINVNKLSIPIDNDVINTTNEQKYELYRQDPYNVTEKNVSDNLTRQNLIKVNKLSIPIENDVINTTNEQKYELYRQDPYNITEKNVSDNLTRQNLINVNKLSIPIDNDVTNTTNEQKYELYRQDPYNQTQKNVSAILPRKNIFVTNESTHELYNQDSYYDTEQNASVILTRKNLIDVNNLSFPIDNDVTGIHIAISPSKTTEGVLISPSGYSFSFSKNAFTTTVKYSQGSFFENQSGFFELHLNFSTSSRSNIGIWQMKLENLRDSYNVSVFAYTSISAEVSVYQTGYGVYEIPKDVLKLGVTGKFGHITDISVLDSNGETVLSNISYKFNNNRLKYVTENIDNVPDARNQEINAEFSRLQNTQPVYALIKGKDLKGNIFQRLGAIFGLGRSDVYPQQFLTVEVGAGSELITDSGKKAEVYFEVTNHASTAQLVIFSCSDRKYILQSLSIYRRYLEPKESTIVTLYLNAQYGTYQDEITFSATSGSLVIQKKVFVDVGSQFADKTQPDLWHTFKSDCSGVIFTSCTKGIWTIEITARDTESGLLQLNTLPKGIYFPKGYTSGTKDFVTGHYSESCCNPKLQISAVDRMNNVRRYDVNAYFSKLSPGAIAAIILGCLLFIILVAIIIFCICKICSNAKEEYELPTYRGEGI